MFWDPSIVCRVDGVAFIKSLFRLRRSWLVGRAEGQWMGVNELIARAPRWTLDALSTLSRRKGASGRAVLNYKY